MDQVLQYIAGMNRLHFILLALYILSEALPRLNSSLGQVNSTIDLISALIRRFKAPRMPQDASVASQPTSPLNPPEGEANEPK